MTEHPVDEGEPYVAVVTDALSQTVVGCSIGDHMVVELAMAAASMSPRQPMPSVCPDNLGQMFWFAAVLALVVLHK